MGGVRRAARSDTAAGSVHLKRAYEAPGSSDGYRVLVDRLWPRGARRDAVAIDAWMKDVAPSDELRRWFGHEEARWEEFAARYRDELRRSPAAELVDELVAQAQRGPVTLVYGARDELHNQAVVLHDVIDRRLRRAARPSRAARSSGASGARGAAPPPGARASRHG
jgi:uncharacterized protein YeaO (DUF488 family)